jgi:hypothetical protein
MSRYFVVINPASGFGTPPLFPSPVMRVVEVKMSTIGEHIDAALIGLYHYCGNNPQGAFGSVRIYKDPNSYFNEEKPLFEWRAPQA